MKRYIPQPINEDAPMNATANVAGLGTNPPVKKAVMGKMIRRKKQATIFERLKRRSDDQQQHRNKSR